MTAQQSAGITVREKVDGLKKALATRMEVITRTLPSQLMPPARFAQIVTTLCARNPKLLDCNQTSLIGAVLQCAALGLDPEPALGNAWFVPFKGMVQFIPGYKGLATLAWRSGQMASLTMQVVRAGDVFDYEYGSSPFLRHKPMADNEHAAITHAYATGKPIGGEVMFEVMTAQQVKNIQSRSPSARAGSSPWVTDWEAMAKKTAFRRLAKLLPLSTEKSLPLSKALYLDELAENGLKQHNQELLGEFTDAEDESETGESAAEANNSGGKAAG